MSVQYSVLLEHDMLYVRFEGHHETNHTNSLLRQYVKDVRIRPGLRAVLDFARISSAELDVAMRQKIMLRLLSIFKAPDRDWSVSYYCPTEVSRSFTAMQQRMWENQCGVDFMMARSPVALAQRLDMSINKMTQILGEQLPTHVQMKKRLPFLGALSRFSL